MTSLERALYRRRTLLFIIAALLFLGGAIGVVYLQVRQESDRADSLAQEADLRGTAVSTLAGDVLALRAQVQAGGHTPVAPDPAKAVPSLPDRTAVPVQIPGPPGPKGDPGPAGPSASPGPTGPAGSPGTPGADSTVPGPAGSPGAAGVQGSPGPAGAAGQDGKDGTNGRDGADGKPPAGWTYTDPAGVAYTCTPVADFDPAAPRYTCSADTAPPSSSPSPSTSRGGLLGVVMLASSAVYRRI